MTRTEFATRAAIGLAAGALMVPVLVAAFIAAERIGTDRNRAVLRQVAEARKRDQRKFDAHVGGAL